MTKSPNAPVERFQMVKQHHYRTFHTAVKTQKADKAAIPLCTFLNDQTKYFTTSSCAGRILLLNVDSMETKQETAFLYKSHETANALTAWNSLGAPTRNEVWFKQEPFILHIGTDSLENANRILSCSREAGIKRGGIMVAKPGKFLLELLGTQGISAPVKHKKELLVDEKYFGFLVKRANLKLEKNAQQLQRFERIVREKL
ncbi:MAG: tRNA wybutosine-synthesizing 3 family protein [Candidatus Diapherotrites archaeon]|nr:tRNA wybutosine-synthesizing 3 family protein [Candidatus Diapherotrites archaeon]